MFLETMIMIAKMLRELITMAMLKLEITHLTCRFSPCVISIISDLIIPLITFARSSGNFHSTIWSLQFKNACRFTGINQETQLHRLQNCFASNSGSKILRQLLLSFLSHSSVTTTKVYTNPNLDSLI